MARESGSSGHVLVDVLDRVLDKGIVIDAAVRISVVGIELLGVDARVVVASIETYLLHADTLAYTDLAAGPRRAPPPPLVAEPISPVEAAPPPTLYAEPSTAQDSPDAVEAPDPAELSSPEPGGDRAEPPSDPAPPRSDPAAPPSDAAAPPSDPAKPLEDS